MANDQLKSQPKQTPKTGAEIAKKVTDTQEYKILMEKSIVKPK
jgi:hypothetical protein